MTNRSKQSDKISASAKTSNRDSLVKLRAHVNDIENRLKRANSLTKSSVTALTTSFEHLHANGGFDKNTQRLAQYIDDLAGQLNGLIEQTRIDVAHDLKAVMSDPRLETVSAALTKANQRLTSAEAQQAEAIGAINGQIAKLATAIDARMRREVRAREESIAALDTKIGTAHDALEKNQLVFEASLNTTREINVELGSRIDAVETLSADAVKTIGDKVVSVTEDLQQQTQILQQQTQALKNDVGEQGLDLQKGYEEHKEEIARRIESLEDDQRNTIPSLERRLITLATRLEVVESYEPVAPAPAAQAHVHTPPPFNMPETVETPVADITTPSHIAPMSPSAPFGASQTDAFSPSEPVILKSVPAPQNPYANQAVVEDDVLDLMAGTATQPAQPTEYVPQEYIPQDYEPQDYVPEVYTPNAYVADTPIATLDNSQYPAEYAPRHAPFNVETGAFEQSRYEQVPQQAAPVLEPTMPAPATLETSPPPFAGGMPPMDAGSPSFGIDPSAQSMSDARPGAEPEKKSRFKRTKAKKIKKNKPPKDPSGNGGSGGGGIPAPLRLGGLMVGVTVVGLFAAKTLLPKVMGNQAKPTVQAKSTARPEVQQVNATQQGNVQAQAQAQQPTTQPLQTVAAVGDYSQTMQAPDLGVGVDGQASAQKLTLEAAATNGEPIAQFQLGLSHLEAGRNAQAVRLIRLAANQGQPAAQYRLGKLYEAGVGVESNLTTAMDLLEKSAASGNRIAMHDLGHYHATGAAGEANIATAVDWFNKAAERGVLDSQFNLGVLYQGDSGISRDLVSSYVWFAIAGAQGDKVAEQRGALVARDLSKAQLSEGKTRVEAFSPTRINDAANGVFRDLPWATKSATAAVDISRSVKGAQTMLSNLGYDVGTPDGAMGPRTRNAVISFERANGLPETGRVNAALVDRLALASGA